VRNVHGWLVIAAIVVPHPSGFADADFQALSADIIASHLQARPIQAVKYGIHEHDGRYLVPDREMLARESGRFAGFLEALDKVDLARLTTAERTDWRILRQALSKDRWELEVQRQPWRDPLFYTRNLDISVYLKRDFKPLPERVRDMAAILRFVPATLAAARDNLEPVLAKPVVESGIKSAEGMASFLEKDLADEAGKIGNGPILDEFRRANTIAAAEFRSFVEWLAQSRLPAADESFALGTAAYAEMLRADYVDMSPADVLELGLGELEREQARFVAAAAEVDPTASAVDTYRAIQREHPTAEGLLPEARKNVELIRSFLVDRNIVTIPSEVRPIIAETLPPFRATSFASMSTPGPFEKKATEAYYYITPVDATWSPKQQEEWLTAYNYYTTDVLTIHEAYPGHYLQTLALNASPASDAAKLFHTYAFVEGWAHYAEQMLIEEGFAQPADVANASRDERVRAAKYRLAQSGEALLRVCRLCCSVRMHTENMSLDEATRFFMANCHYELQPARQEATRGTFDPGYLYYTLGKLQIVKLREDWRDQEGDRFTMQRFHDEFLSHGAPPIALLREVMLQRR